MDSVSLYQQGVGPELGVAFLMNLEAVGATFNERYVGDLTNATVDVFGDGQRYKLVEMGAVMTNWGEVGTKPAIFKRDYQDERGRVVDVPAKVFYNVTDTTVTYAVRIIEIPYYAADTLIYARPYYVFEMDGEEIVVYGDIYSRSYNGTDG